MTDPGMPRTRSIASARVEASTALVLTGRGSHDGGSFSSSNDDIAPVDVEDA